MANERDARGEAAKDEAETRLRLTFGNVLKLSRGSGSRSGFRSLYSKNLLSLYRHLRPLYPKPKLLYQPV